MSNFFNKNIIIIIGTLFWFACMYIIYTSEFYATSSGSLLSNLIMAAYSSFFSYQISKIFNRKQYEEELKKIGDITVRKAKATSKHLLEISSDLEEQNEELAKILNIISDISHDTVEDILLITGANETADLEKIWCLGCGTAQKVKREHVGKSVVMQCKNCGMRHNIHFVKNGIIIKFIGYDYENKNIIKEKVSIKCPNKDCSNVILHDKKTGEKNLICFECETSFVYNFESKEVSDINKINPKVVMETSTGFDGENWYVCPICGTSNPDKRFTLYNNNGDRYCWCKSCKNLIKILNPHIRPTGRDLTAPT